MSTISKAYVLVINGDLPGGRNALLKSITDANPISEKPVWMMGDICALHVYFRTPGTPGEDSVSVELPEEFSMILAACSTQTPGTILFTVSDWTKQGEADVYYEGTVNLNTPELAAAFESLNSEELDLLLDIEVRNAGGTSRITYRAELSLAGQVYSGESTPNPLTLPRARCSSPDGSVWEIGVTDDGETTWTKVAS